MIMPESEHAKMYFYKKLNFRGILTLTCATMT